MTRESNLSEQFETTELPEAISERFDIVDILGEGGFATTYRARKRSSEQEVALKVIRVEQLDDWKAFELFEREAKVLRRLDYPRIPE